MPDPNLPPASGPATTPEQDHAGVVALPPFIFLAALLLGLLLQWLRPMHILPGSMLRLWAGATLIIAGAAIELWFAGVFRATGQDPNPNTPTPVIVAHGPFRVSRNPAYVGLVAIYAGLALALDNAWLPLLLVPVLLVMHYGVILREERYLERKFGDEYRRYKASVRRWL